MSLLINKTPAPLEVSFSANSGKCDWANITQERLQQQYSDMIIKVLSKDGEELKFHVELKGGITDENVVRTRFYEFLRRTRSMKVWNMEVKPIIKS